MSQVSEPKVSNSLQDLLANLRESNTILENSEGKLYFLATNSTPDKKDSESSHGDSATLKALMDVAQSIGRNASAIAKNTNMIVGN